MTNGDFGDDRLREAFALSDSLPGRRDECPASERLWESARGKAGERENEKIIRHLAGCASCSTSWRLARDLAGSETAIETVAAPRRADRWSWVPLAAAALLILAVGVTLEAVRVSPPGPPAYRSEEGSWIRPAADLEGAIPRDRFVLRWSAGPDGSTYDVRIVAEGRGPLARGLGLVQPEFRVPPSSFAGVAPGTKILWQVTVRLPNGRVSDSPAFLARVQ